MKQAMALAAFLSVFHGTCVLDAQTDRRFSGEWRGTRSERNPVNGQTFTVNFTFDFRPDGTYQQIARIGRLTLLKLEGRYSLRPGRKPGNPSFTHILTLVPERLAEEPGRDELRLLQIADLPNVERTEQYAAFYDLAPAGGLTLQDRAGGESWVLQRVP